MVFRIGIIVILLIPTLIFLAKILAITWEIRQIETDQMIKIPYIMLFVWTVFTTIFAILFFVVTLWVFWSVFSQKPENLEVSIYDIDEQMKELQNDLEKDLEDDFTPDFQEEDVSEETSEDSEQKEESADSEINKELHQLRVEQLKKQMANFEQLKSFSPKEKFLAKYRQKKQQAKKEEFDKNSMPL